MSHFLELHSRREDSLSSQAGNNWIFQALADSPACGEMKTPLGLLFAADLGNDNTGWSKASPLPRQQEPEGKTSSHLAFIPPPGKASDGNGFLLLLPDGEVSHGLQTEIASRLNWKCLSTFYFCPGWLLGAGLSHPRAIPGMGRELFLPTETFPAAGKLVAFIPSDGFNSPQMTSQAPDMSGQIFPFSWRAGLGLQPLDSHLVLPRKSKKNKIKKKNPLSLWDDLQSPDLCSSADPGNGSEPAKTLLQILPPPINRLDALERGCSTLSRGKRDLWKAILCCSLRFSTFPSLLQDICSGAEAPPELRCCHEVMSPHS